MTPKQKRAVAALVVSAIVAASALLAPGVRCAPPDPALIEDALGGESSSGSDPAGSAEAPALDLGSPAGEPSSSSSSGGA